MAVPQKIKARIEYIKRYPDKVTLFSLTPNKKCNFKPGQFLHFALDDYDPSFNWPESRVFSIVNSPLRENVIEILVSPKGSFTNRMINELKVNDEVWIKLPYGIFNFNDASDADCVLIAGGTGISPFISFLEYILQSNQTLTSLTLFYGVRNKELIIFDELINECQEKLKKFSCSIFIENEFISDKGNFFRGILPVTEIVNTTIKLAEPVYYLSGPTSMINAFSKELKHKNIIKEKIFFDSWE